VIGEYICYHLDPTVSALSTTFRFLPLHRSSLVSHFY